MTRSTHEASEKGIPSMYDEIEMGSSFLLFLKSFCRAAAVPGIIVENHEEIFHNDASSTPVARENLRFGKIWVGLWKVIKLYFFSDTINRYEEWEAAKIDGKIHCLSSKVLPPTRKKCFDVLDCEKLAIMIADLMLLLGFSPLNASPLLLMRCP